MSIPSHGSRKRVTHSRIDDGEDIPECFKMTPVLLPDGFIDIETLLILFESKANRISSSISSIIIEKIKAFKNDRENKTSNG